MNWEENYLTNMPNNISEYGLCKTLLVHRAVIHIKHIMTEVFNRKTVEINKYLEYLGYDIIKYVEYLTNLMRKVHHFDRAYRYDLDTIVKTDSQNLFDMINMHSGIKSTLILDFDGVCTSHNFHKLYELLHDKIKIEICTANPTVTNEYFEKNNLRLPKEIHAMKGKLQKIKRLIEIRKKYDVVFYIDNETEYLEYAWLFGIYTYHYRDNKIKLFTLNTK